ncbi:MAG: ABC transporter permease [Anaerolineae bacterium]|nr:ABC transporter permease [Anaerolineae bacterium]
MRAFLNSRWGKTALPLIFGLVLVAGWEMLYRSGIYPPFIVPAPADVASKLVTVLQDGTLGRHTLATLQEVLLGLLFGVTLAVLLGYLIARSALLEQILTPYIVALQAVPVVAIAPLLVIWFGSGLESKVLICALTVFFPMLINTIVGVRSVPPDLHDLMSSLEASRWQRFRHLEAPAALPVLMGGLKVSATLSVIGAVVGEFVSARAGLGFLVNSSRSVFDTPLMIVSVLALSALALSLYGLVSLLERFLLGWQRRAQ